MGHDGNSSKKIEYPGTLQELQTKISEAESVENPINFVLAGKAVFTVQNEKTGNRFTFKVSQADNDRHIWFVSVLNGPDNGSNFAYIGTIFHNTFKWTGKSVVNPDSQCFQVFNWFFKNLINLPQFVTVHHEGCCGKCGRRLTVPESIKTGLGPVCAGKE